MTRGVTRGGGNRRSGLAERVAKDAFSNFLGEDKFGVAKRKLRLHHSLSLPLSLSVYVFPGLCCALGVYVSRREVEETRTRFDSWATRPGIFLIHNQPVTYCDPARGIIETARL